MSVVVGFDIKTEAMLNERNSKVLNKMFFFSRLCDMWVRKYENEKVEIDGNWLILFFLYEELDKMNLSVCKTCVFGIAHHHHTHQCPNEIVK